MRPTLTRLGSALSKEFTIVFIPSSLEIIRSGLSALRALKPLKKVRLVISKASRIQLRMDDRTIMKSRMFHESFR